MQLRTFNIGCFGGGTGLPSLLGGLKTNPWLTVNAVVTMFDSGGSSGVLRDELGVLPPGDVLKCALALARNEREGAFQDIAGRQHAELVAQLTRAAAAVEHGDDCVDAEPGIVLQAAEQARQPGAAAEAADVERLQAHRNC